MKHLFYLMGKSASGKDTLYEALLEDPALGLKPLFGDSYFQPFKMIATTCRPVGGKFRVKGKKKTELLFLSNT